MGPNAPKKASPTKNEAQQSAHLNDFAAREEEKRHFELSLKNQAVYENERRRAEIEE